MDGLPISMDIPSLKKKFDDAVSPFKGKEKENIQKNGSFDRKMLIETVFALIDVCENAFDVQTQQSCNTENIAEACAERTEAVLRKFMEKTTTQTEKCAERTESVLRKFLVKTSSPTDTANAASKMRDSDVSHVLVVENKDSDSERYTSATWSDVVRSSISNKLKDVPVSNTIVNRQGQGCIFLPSEKACADAKKALDSDFKLSATEKNSNKLWPKLKVHNLPTADCTVDDLHDMIVSKNPDVNNVLSVNSHAKLSVIFIDKKHNFAVLKVTPDVREVIMKRARLFVGMSSLFVSDHYHVERCYACQQFGHKQGSESCPAKNSHEVCVFCAGSHKSSDCRNKTCQLCANCAKSSSHTQKKNAKFHSASSTNCPVYQKEVEKLKLKICLDVKNYV